MVKTTSSFQMPKDGDIFIRKIIERSKDLIITGIWQGIELNRLDLWMTNFSTPEERYFAASILDALIFRSHAQTVALMWQLFQRTLPDLVREEPPREGPRDLWYQALCRSELRGDPEIRIVPVIRDTDPPSKSGPLMCRLYRRELQLSQKWMIWPWRIKDEVTRGVKIVIFIDDFLGTGDQFQKFAHRFQIEEQLKHMYSVYAPLVAHADGIKQLKHQFPFLKVRSVEALDKTHNLFDEESGWFHDQTNTAGNALGFYYSLLKAKKITLKRMHRKGYGKFALAYAFSHATPDNCIPILWLRHKNWNPLIER